MQSRLFVLVPLAAVAPHWRHPVSGKSVAELIAALAANGSQPGKLPSISTCGR
jgi:7,8-dihydro-6-hydroxymethylpterin-pyrophosphokinase